MNHKKVLFWLFPIAIIFLILSLCIDIHLYGIIGMWRTIVPAGVGGLIGIIYWRITI